MKLWCLPIAAQETPTEPPWIPSFTLGLGVHLQDVEGAIASTLREPAAAKEDFFFPVVPIGLQLKAPGLEFVPAAPRPFVHAGWQFTMDSDATVANEGDPDDLVYPEDISRADAEDIAGQGSEVTADQKYQWFAGLGVAFPFEIADQKTELKVSVDYFGQLTDLGALVVHVTGPMGGPFEEIRIQGSESFLLHGLGPRLGIEVEALAAGPFFMSVFADANVYLFLSDTDTTATFSDPSGTAAITYETDPYLFQAAVGVRFNWRGF
jgi:hypothetical protein